MMSNDENIRESFRVPLHNIVGEYSHKGSVDKCEVVDLAFSGLGIKISHILPEGEVIDIRFHLDKYGRVYCKGKVVVARGGRLGVSFIDIPEKSKRHVQKYIEDFTNSNINKMLNSKKK